MIKIQIIGTQVACRQEIKDPWREVVHFFENQLNIHFKEKVSVQYFDLFDKDCPVIPTDARIPIVIIDGVLFSSGEKLSIPRIRSYLETKLSSPM